MRSSDLASKIFSDSDMINFAIPNNKRSSIYVESFTPNLDIETIQPEQMPLIDNCLGTMTLKSWPTENAQSRKTERLDWNRTKKTSRKNNKNPKKLIERNKKREGIKIDEATARTVWIGRSSYKEPPR